MVIAVKLFYCVLIVLFIQTMISPNFDYLIMLLFASTSVAFKSKNLIVSPNNIFDIQSISALNIASVSWQLSVNNQANLIYQLFQPIGLSTNFFII